MLSPEIKREIRDALAGLTGTAARHVARELKERTGVSVRQIYKLTADLRARKPRADAGKRRIEITDDARDQLYALVGSLGFKAELALEVASANGLIATDADAPAPGTLLRWMRDDGAGKHARETDRVCRRWQADYPDQLHQADCTISATFYLDDSGGVGHEPLRDQSNKPGNKRPRLHLFVLVDDFSRATYARYYLEENTGNWLDFLWHAWGPKPDPSVFPFEGVPEVLYCDNGSPLKSERAQRAIGALGVRPKYHRPYHPQSKGKVERRIGTIQANFERLFLLQKPKTLGEANDLLYRHLIGANMREHSQTHQRPLQRWLLRSTPVKRLPAEHILKMLGRVRDTRVLGPDLTFSLGGQRFLAPYVEPFRSMPRGQKVEVLWSPECPFEVLVVSGRSAFAAIHVPAGMDPAEVSGHLPAADQAKTRTNETMRRVASAGIEHLDGFAHEAQAPPLASWLPQPGVETPVTDDVPERALTEIKAIRILQDAGILARPPGEAGRMLMIHLMGGASTVAESTITGIIKRSTRSSPTTPSTRPPRAA